MKSSILVALLGLSGCLSPPSDPADDDSDGSPGDAPDGGDDAPAECEPIAFEDDFEVDSIGAKWITWGDGQKVVTGGRAIISPDSDGSSYGGLTSVDSFDFEGKCLWAKVPEALDLESIPADAYPEVFLIAADGDNGLSIGLQDGQICCEVKPGAVVCPEDYDSFLHRWWRLRVGGGSVTCDVSRDGVTWKPLPSLDVPFPVDDFEVDLHAGIEGSTPAPGSAKFDDINLTD